MRADLSHILDATACARRSTWTAVERALEIRPRLLLLPGVGASPELTQLAAIVCDAVWSAMAAGSAARASAAVALCARMHSMASRSASIVCVLERGTPMTTRPPGILNRRTPALWRRLLRRESLELNRALE